jgi:hypothetical protein
MFLKALMPWLALGFLTAVNIIGFKLFTTRVQYFGGSDKFLGSILAPVEPNKPQSKPPKEL